MKRETISGLRLTPVRETTASVPLTVAERSCAAALTYAGLLGTLTAAFRYRDEMADREEELRIGFADGRWAVAEGTADVTVICRQGDLAALLMGSCGLTALLRLGAASADDAEKARQLAQLLYCVQKPWLNADY